MNLSTWKKRWEELPKRLPKGTTAFHWHAEDGFGADVFGDVLVLSLSAEKAEAEERALAQALADVSKASAVYLKRRPQEARRAANEAKDWVSPPKPLVGQAVDSLEILEWGARYAIRPANGLSVGLYLDARDARQWVRDNAKNRRLLNLFSYTCGYGLSAALGGAKETVNVDLSKRVLDWGQENYALNGVSGLFWCRDVLSFLAKPLRGEPCGALVFDPPSFATGKASRFSAAKDYFPLLAQAASWVEPGGWCLAACNLRSWTQAGFEARVMEVLRPRRPKRLASLPASNIDFPGGGPLRAVAVELN